MSRHIYDWAAMPLVKMVLFDEIEIDGDNKTVTCITYDAPPIYLR